MQHFLKLVQNKTRYLQILLPLYLVKMYMQKIKLVRLFFYSLLQIFFTHYSWKLKRPMGMYKKDRIASFAEFPRGSMAVLRENVNV